MGDQRARTFFITINKGANCYMTFERELDKTTYYSFILHDKDLDELGELKEPHYHLLVKYKNPRTFSAVKKDFDGGHIEVSNNPVSCIKYLLHKTAKSFVDGKHEYQIDEIKTSDLDYTTMCLSQREIEQFNPDEILTYFQEGCIELLDMYLRFGSQINGYTSLIEKLSRAWHTTHLKDLVNPVNNELEENKEQDEIDYILNGTPKK